MSELLKKQKFGVEVEFTGITRTMAAEAVAEILEVMPPDLIALAIVLIRFEIAKEEFGK